MEDKLPSNKEEKVFFPFFLLIFSISLSPHLPLLCASLRFSALLCASLSVSPCIILLVYQGQAAGRHGTLFQKLDMQHHIKLILISSHSFYCLISSDSDALVALASPRSLSIFLVLQLLAFILLNDSNVFLGKIDSK